MSLRKCMTKSVKVNCTSCGSSVNTRVESEKVGTLDKIKAGMVLCVLGLCCWMCCGCCLGLVPCCRDDLFEFKHFCPNCGYMIGKCVNSSEESDEKPKEEKLM